VVYAVFSFTTTIAPHASLGAVTEGGVFAGGVGVDVLPLLHECKPAARTNADK
jgi:hypothetical protein